MQVECIEDVQNPGRLHISYQALLAYAAQSQEHGEARAMMSRMAFRLLGLGLFAACAMQLGGDPLFARVAAVLAGP